MDSLDASSKYVKDKMDNRSTFISYKNQNIYQNQKSFAKGSALEINFEW